MSLVIFEDVEIEIQEDNLHEFTQSTNDVAKAYYGNPSNKTELRQFSKQIRQARLNNLEDFIEGKHFYYSKDSKNRKIMLWTKKGVVRLGFFIKSNRAKKFRDWAEDYILNGKQNINAIKRGYLSQLAQKDKLIAELKSKQKQLPKPNDCILSNKPFAHNKLLNMLNGIEKTKESFDQFMGAVTETMHFQSQILNMYPEWNNKIQTLKETREEM